MKKLTLFLLLAVSLNSFAQTKNFIDQNYIEVRGSAEMEIVPNEIYLRILVNEEDFKGKENLNEVEKKIISSLKSIGINVSENFTVIDMASNFKKYWLKSTEISSRKEYQLKVTDAKTAGQVFRSLEAIGVANVSIAKIDHSDIEKYKQEVKIMAIKAAKEKAQAIATAIDQNVGKAIYINEIEHNYPFQNRAMGYLSNVKIEANVISDTEQPEIEFEKIQLNYAIESRFELN